MEAAVLILVFPPLEFFLARRSGDNSQLTNVVAPIGISSVMKWSVILCMSLLAASIWLKEIAHRRGADDEED